MSKLELTESLSERSVSIAIVFVVEVQLQHRMMMFVLLLVVHSTTSMQACEVCHVAPKQSESRFNQHKNSCHGRNNNATHPTADKGGFYRSGTVV